MEMSYLQKDIFFLFTHHNFVTDFVFGNSYHLGNHTNPKMELENEQEQ